jgi:hypothetical protein
LTTEYLNNKIFEANIAKFKEIKQDKLRYELIIGDLEEAYKKNGPKVLLRTETLNQKKQQYKQLCNDYKDMQSLLAKDFFKIAEGIISYRRFHFVDTDDAIQEFVMICFEKLDRFDPNYRGKNGQKAKAFNYITTCVLNSYRQLYRTARNYNELKRKYSNYLHANANVTDSNKMKIKKKT